MVFNRIKTDTICQYVSLFAIKEMKPARSDQSSLSFGRRLNKAEQELTAAKAEIKDLREKFPEGQQLQAAAAKIEDQQRRSARLVKDPSSSAEKLASIDPTTLSTANREILRSRLTPAAATPAMFAPDSAAAQRISNWQQLSQDSVSPAAPAAWPSPPSAFEKWQSDRQATQQQRQQSQLRDQQQWLESFRQQQIQRDQEAARLAKGVSYRPTL